MNREYLETAHLLIHVAPLVFVDDQFGLKGGTVVNLFLPPGRAPRRGLKSARER
jgi:hypothetical protein